MDNKTLIVSAHQPGYLPYIGFFNKVMQSDVFVLLDDRQYVRKEWHNRNRIRDWSKGWVWLTIPVRNPHHVQQINEVTIDNSRGWQKRHWKSIQAAYRKAPFFEQHEAFFEEVYSTDWGKLIEINEAIIWYLLNALDIHAKLIKGSTLQSAGTKTEYLIDICRTTKSDTYLSGIGGRQYLDEGRFTKADITLMYQDFHHPTYPQRQTPFIPYMSIIDMLFNLGSKDSRKLIRNSGGMVPAGT